MRAFAAKAESLALADPHPQGAPRPKTSSSRSCSCGSKWDTEYAKFIDPKLQILQELEEHKHPSIREAVEPFLQDVNEPSRFHAVAATFTQKDPAAIPALLTLLLDEESVRVRAKIADGFVALGWEVPETSATRSARSCRRSTRSTARASSRSAADRPGFESGKRERAPT